MSRIKSTFAALAEQGKKGLIPFITAGDPDYGRLWKLVNDRNGDRYNAYQKKTTRLIPLVALTRAE